MVTDTTPKGPESLRVIRGLVFLLAALLLVAAVYYYFVPVHVASKEGVFGCGSASNPPSADKDGFQFGACQKSAVVNQFRTYALLGGAVVTLLAGYLIFRTPRSEDWDEDIDLADREDDETRRGERRAERKTPAERRTTTGRASRSERPEDTRTLRGARRDEPVSRVAADDVDDEPAPSRRGSTDDWEGAVTDEPRGRAARRDDDFLDDEVDDLPPRRSRRRRDDDF